MSEFNLKAALRLTGLTASTLRAWERRYGAVRPKRTATGRRFYSSAEVNRLTLLSTLVRRGFRIGDLAKLSDLELTRKSEASRVQSPLAATSNQGVADLIAALDRFDLGELRARIARVRYQLSPRDFALDLVPAVMSRVGTLIDENRFSIAQEHALSHLIQSELRLIYDSLESLDGSLKPAKKMVFGAREGDFHEIGLMLAAILCRSEGIECQYLGPNLPAESWAKAVRTLRPFAVVLALSYLPPEEERVTARDFVKALDRSLPASIELWTGGSASQQVRSLGRQGQSRRNLWVFESLRDLEIKLAGLTARKSELRN